MYILLLKYKIYKQKTIAYLFKKTTIFVETFFFLLSKISLVPVENKQDMSDTSITLLWSTISSVGFFPVDMYRL